MSTTVRPELSKKNCYWITNHRAYELRHFCLQYPEWKKLYSKLESELLPKCVSEREKVRLSGTTNPTERVAILRASYKTKIDMIEETAREADPELYEYLILNVTEGVSYTNLVMMHGMPCSKDTFFNRRYKFFWLLSQKRD